MRIDTIEGMTCAFVVLAALFAAAERLWPARARARYFARGRITDWVYWPFSSFVTGNLTRAATLGVVALFAVALGYRGAPGDLAEWVEAHRRWGIGTLPIPAQLAVVLATGDLVNYWNHRLRHTRALWLFHSVHHAPRTLDWLSSVRMHPVDDLLDNVLVGLVVVALGASIPVWLATGPILFFFNMWLHANLSWRFGPLEYVIATPAFHRAHHADEAASRPCNFAGVLPLWDIVFGTFRAPEASPASFGPGDTAVPEGLLRQLVFPFRELLRELSPPRAPHSENAAPREFGQ